MTNRIGRRRRQKLHKARAYVRSWYRGFRLVQGSHPGSGLAAVEHLLRALDLLDACGRSQFGKHPTLGMLAIAEPGALAFPRIQALTNESSPGPATDAVPGSGRTTGGPDPRRCGEERSPQPNRRNDR